MSRDVLAPPFQTMSHNRKYRVNVVHEDFGGNKWNSGNKKIIKGYEEDGKANSKKCSFVKHRIF